ncbi:riboflavin synthase [Treponema pectinovorum]|uniref:riboflavin synthase n=1 Tax=Treponema pectinovorum TaxID=164 RepID=UPI003D906754
MFTGIIEETGIVKSIAKNMTSLILKISCSFAKELVIGESVAVNGACLTVSKKTQEDFDADVTPETFRRTSLSLLSTESIVNLERAMKADGRFGGHIVSGHVDTTARFISATKEENAVNIKLSVESKFGRYIIEKGSICLDGISLTVSGVETEGEKTLFTVAVIPHTWQNTNLCKKKSGQILNIECDLIGKYIEHLLTWDKNQKKDDEQNLQSFMTGFTSFH